jgi:hypothetical protein
VSKDKTELRYTVQTLAEPDTGRIHQTLYAEYEDFKEEIYHVVMETREQGVREALIRLGWTPPKDKPK